MHIGRLLNGLCVLLFVGALTAPAGRAQQFLPWSPQQWGVGGGSSEGPSLATFQDRLYAAWKGVGTDDRMFWSSFDGRTWAPQQIGVGGGSSTGPALAVFQNRLFAVWKGAGADPRMFWSNSFDGNAWAPQQVGVGGGTSHRPAIAEFQGKLYAAWKGVGTDDRMFWSSFDGRTWAPQQIGVGGGSSTGPALAVFQNRLFAVWKGAGADPRMFWSSFDGNAWAPQQVGVGGGTDSGPALAVYRTGLNPADDRLFAVWKGVAADERMFWSSFDGSTWSLQQVGVGGGTSARPAIAAFRNPLFAAWKGVDGDERMFWSFMDLDRSPLKPVLVSPAISNWGKLANPGFDQRPIKTVLFFAGQPLDGTGIEKNVCRPSVNATACYSARPLQGYHLDWRSPVNRLYVLDDIVDLGFNTISMSSWGESWLPCEASCPQIPALDCQGDPSRDTTEWRCGRNQRDGSQTCRIGWFGSAPMQVSSAAQDELFDAAVHKPLVIMPFIESRFRFDWDFHDEFPFHPSTREPSPGLVSQIKDLINRYIKNPRNPAWREKWAQVYDQDGIKRYAVVIVQVASSVVGLQEHEAFARGFDAVADKVEADTNGVKVGFFIDPVPGDPQPSQTFGCLSGPPPQTLYRGESKKQDSIVTFWPDPERTGPKLRRQRSILGIHSYLPEGWIDRFGNKVNECFKLKWKKDWSRRWHDTGLPFLQDVTSGYDGHILFQNTTNLLTTWGNNNHWRQELLGLVKRFGHKGLVYNSWNGYCEGLAGMATGEYGNTNVQWIRQLNSQW